MKKRRKYTEEFKREAVRLMKGRGSRTVDEIAKGLGVPKNHLHRWRLELEGVKQETETIDAATADADVAQENERLRRRVRELEMEREILKKAAAFFGKEGM